MTTQRKNGWLWNLPLALAFVATAFLCIPSAWADDDDEEDEGAAAVAAPQEKTWEEEKKEIEDFMNKCIADKRDEMDRKITEQVTVKFIQANIRARRKVAKLGDFKLLRLPGIEVDWKNANAGPSKSKERIIDEITREARDRALDRHYPLSELSRYMPTSAEIAQLPLKERNEMNEEKRRKMALNKKVTLDAASDERFVLYEPGDYVSVELRSGRGPSTQIDNKRYVSKDDERVIIDNRIIIREDLDISEQAHFYADINKEYKEHYIRSTVGQVESAMESQVDIEVRERTPGEFLKCGFVPDITKPTASLRTAKPEFWVEKRGLYNNCRTYLIKQAVERFKINELPNKMREQGYIEYPTADGKGKEWITQAEKMRREQPQQPGADGAGGYPGGYPGGMGPQPGGPMPGR